MDTRTGESWAKPGEGRANTLAIAIETAPFATERHQKLDFIFSPETATELYINSIGCRGARDSEMKTALNPAAHAECDRVFTLASHAGPDGGCGVDTVSRSG